MQKPVVIVKRMVNGKKQRIVINRTETVEEYRARTKTKPVDPAPPLAIFPVSPVKVKNRKAKAEKKRRAKELQNLNRHQLIKMIVGLRSTIDHLEKSQSETKKPAHSSLEDPTNFYYSPEWRALRYRVFKTYGRVCALCRTTEGQMHVDHIKPRSLFPELALVFENLQVLCRDCNLGKSNRDETDWRAQELSRCPA